MLLGSLNSTVSDRMVVFNEVHSLHSCLTTVWYNKQLKTGSETNILVPGLSALSKLVRLVPEQAVADQIDATAE
jgi:hypothetical protein